MASSTLLYIDIQKLAKLLCILILDKSGQVTQPLALGLKLLFQNGGMDLHTLIEAVFHFFGEWCHHKTEEGGRDRSGSDSSRLLSEEPVLHIFATVNILLARSTQTLPAPCLSEPYLRTFKNWANHWAK